MSIMKHPGTQLSENFLLQLLCVNRKSNFQIESDFVDIGTYCTGTCSFSSKKEEQRPRSLKQQIDLPHHFHSSQTIEFALEQCGKIPTPKGTETSQMISHPVLSIPSDQISVERK